MSNVNTIADAIIKNGISSPVVLALTTTGHVQFTQSGAVVTVAIPNPEYPLDTNTPFPSRSADGVPFILQAAGLIQLGRGVNYQIDINQSSGLTPAIATTGSQTSPLGAGLYLANFRIVAELLWDSTSQKLRGIQYGHVGENQISQAATVPSSPANLAALQFNVAVTVANANAGNQFTLTDFSAALV